jgi:8-hydroxy-5-deazaflavin:NADPH oxidoreductase
MQGKEELRHTVKIGSRDPNQKKVIEWGDKHGKEEATRASSGTFAETASFSDLNVTATSWDGIADAMKIADPKNFAGKIVTDVTNPLDFSKGMLADLLDGSRHSR